MMLASLLPLLPPAIIVGGTGWYSRRHFDLATTALLLLSILLYYFQFYHSSWMEFSVDAESHMDNVHFILEHHRIPTHNDHLAAARHPPGFYLATAAMLRAGQLAGLADPEQFARHLAMACYAVFILMGAHLLHLLLAETRGVYFSSLLLLLFWPVGVTMGGRITCDLLLFAAEAGALYTLVRWIKLPTPHHLVAPFLWGGMAVMGKNSGVLMIGLALLALLATAYHNRHQLSVLRRADLLYSIIFALLCYWLTFRHGSIVGHLDLYKGYHWDYLWDRVRDFNLFLLLFDTDLGMSQDSFWNMWLHTLLLGGSTMRWNSPSLLLTTQVLWGALLLYGFAGIIYARKQLQPLERYTLALFLFFTLFMIASALYLLMRTTNPNYMDARYAYPAMLAVPLLHGIAMKHHLLAGRTAMVKTGTWLSLSLAATTVILIGTQHLLI